MAVVLIGVASKEVRVVVAFEIDFEAVVVLGVNASQNKTFVAATTNNPTIIIIVTIIVTVMDMLFDDRAIMLCCSSCCSSYFRLSVGNKNSPSTMLGFDEVSWSRPRRSLDHSITHSLNH